MKRFFSSLLSVVMLALLLPAVQISPRSIDIAPAAVSAAPVNCGAQTLAWSLFPIAPATSVDYYYSTLDVSAIDSLVDITPFGSGVYNAVTHTIRWGGNGAAVFLSIPAGGAQFALNIQPKTGVDAGGFTLTPVSRVQPQPGGALQDFTSPSISYAFSGCAPNIAPVSSFTMNTGGAAATALTVAAGSTVNFNGAASVDTDGVITQYEWDYNGDGIYDATSSTSATGSYAFASAGNYYPILRVTDNQGAQSINAFVAAVQVTTVAGVTAPTCSLTPSVATIVAAGTPVGLNYTIGNWGAGVNASIIDSVTGGITSITQASGTLTVMPQVTTSYTLTAQNAGGVCGTNATTTISVSNQAPTFTSVVGNPALIAGGTALTVTAGTPIVVTAQASDPEGATVSFAGSSLLTNLNPAPVFVNTPDQSIFSWTPVTAGTAQLTFAASDGVNTSTRVINITVNAAAGNNSPVISATMPSATGGTVTMLQNDVVTKIVGTPIAVTLTATDPDAGNTIASMTGAVNPAIAGIAPTFTTGAAGNPRTLTMNVTPSAIGNTVVSISAVDNNGATTIFVFTLNIVANIAPEFGAPVITSGGVLSNVTQTGATVTGQAGTSLVLSLPVTDQNVGDVLVKTHTTTIAGGVTGTAGAGNNGTFSLSVPAQVAGATGGATFTATDGTATSTYIINYVVPAAPNAAPTFPGASLLVTGGVVSLLAANSATVTGTTGTPIQIQLNATDPQNVATVLISTAGVAATGNQTVSGVGTTTATAVYTITPNSIAGNGTVTFIATDSQGAQSTFTVNVVVNATPVNTAPLFGTPIVAGGSLSALAATTGTVDATATIPLTVTLPVTDANALDTLTLTPTSGSHPAMVRTVTNVANTGTGTITWAAPVVGSYTAVFTASDGSVQTVFTMTINVSPLNNAPAPTVTGPNLAAVVLGSSFLLNYNATTAGGNAITVTGAVISNTIPNTAAAVFTFTPNQTGDTQSVVFTWTPAATGTGMVSITARDAVTGSAVVFITNLTVTPTAAPIIAGLAAASVTVGNPLTLTYTGTSPVGNALSMTGSIVSAIGNAATATFTSITPAVGTAVLTFNWTPNGAGVATVTISVTDTISGTTVTMPVTITVNAAGGGGGGGGGSALPVGNGASALDCGLIYVPNDGATVPLIYTTCSPVSLQFVSNILPRDLKLIDPADANRWALIPAATKVTYDTSMTDCVEQLKHPYTTMNIAPVAAPKGDVIMPYTVFGALCSSFTPRYTLSIPVPPLALDVPAEKLEILAYNPATKEWLPLGNGYLVKNGILTQTMDHGTIIAFKDGRDGVVQSLTSATMALSDVMAKMRATPFGDYYAFLVARNALPDYFLTHFVDPNTKLMRATVTQMAVVSTQNQALARQLYTDHRQKGHSYVVYPDVKLATWYSPYIAAGTQLGFVHGYPDGLFRPTQLIIRAEAMQIMVNAQEIARQTSLDLYKGMKEKNYTYAYYKDVPVSHWYSRFSALAYQWHLIPQRSAFGAAEKERYGEALQTTARIFQEVDARKK